MDRIISVLSTGIKAILQKCGFYVAALSYENILHNSDIQEIITNLYSKTDVLRMIINVPELFALHPNIVPENGVFFVKCLLVTDNSKVVKIDSTTWSIYETFYPAERIMLVTCCLGNQISILAAWISSVELQNRTSDKNRYIQITLASMDELDDFFRNELDIEIQAQLMEDITNELVKFL